MLLVLLILASSVVWYFSFRILEPGSRLNWVAIAIGISLVGSAIIAGLLNRPLKQISLAVNNVRHGNFDKVKLRENLLTTELQELNRGFNQMSAQLSKVEIDRAVMLAGISHDLRTPLARLRLEIELSMSDNEARLEMSQDIEQINNILNKFLDYARPYAVELKVVNLHNVVQASALAVNNSAKVSRDVIVTFDIPEHLQVLADSVELSRVLNNVLENARRYGKSTIYPFQLHIDLLPAASTTSDNTVEEEWPATRALEEPLEIAQVNIEARAENNWVVLTVKDNGNGVPHEVLNQLNVPFFRADDARSNTTGTGLGLSIVEKAIQSMEGKVKLSNWGVLPKPQDRWNQVSEEPEGGFMVEIKLKRAS